MDRPAAGGAGGTSHVFHGSSPAFNLDKAHSNYIKLHAKCKAYLLNKDISEVKKDIVNRILTKLLWPGRIDSFSASFKRLKAEIGEKTISEALAEASLRAWLPGMISFNDVWCETEHFVSKYGPLSPNAVSDSTRTMTRT